MFRKFRAMLFANGIASISMDASTIIEACKGRGLNGVPKCSLVSDCSTPNPPSQRLTEEQLFPLIHSYFTRSKEEAFRPELQEFCLKNPIVLIYELAKVLELDLSLFSTRTLVEVNPNLSIEIREQIKNASDENWNMTQNKKVWECTSIISRTTVSQYAKYQTRSLENQDVRGDTRALTSRSPGQVAKDKKNQTVKFATNIDLSNARWKQQLEELTKLPSFLKVKCADNMLSYVDYDLLGVNTVQLYMKVPGCRTPGHQENNNFCSVNINIGPGDCEWFAVPHEYWGVIRSLCEENGIDYTCGSWWPPNLSVLYEKNIPVYRFHQKPGDIVWVNAGCVHWVQAIGWCNNIAWNVGPFAARQYQMAMERYEWNKLYQYQSVVPMVYLSWRLACDAKVSNLQLFQLIKNCLLQTMKQNYLLLEFLKHKGVKIIYDDHQTDRTIYCNDCNAEVFNILICKRYGKSKKHVVYCIDCALKCSSSLEGFSCLKKYRMRDLMNIYDKFVYQ